jgi:DNA-binding PadR family transcriptional regulator
MAATSTRLLVLGAVRENGPVHGYELRQGLLSWGADEWANVTPGSIYNALKTLVQDGALEVRGTGRQGARPERTVYQLTPGGEQEFQRLVRQTLWGSRLPNHPLLAGLAFFPLLPREDVAEAMRHRADGLREQAESYRRDLERIEAGQPASSDGVPRHVAESIRLIAGLLESEAAWAEDFVERLEDGELDGLWLGDRGLDG